MPLNAHDPVRVPSPLDAFHRTVIGMRGNAQVFTRNLDGLMMRTVDFASPAACDCGKAAALLECRRVARIVLRFRYQVLFSVRYACTGLGPQVLDQSAAQIDVQELTTVADSQVSCFPSQISGFREAAVHGSIFRRCYI